MSDKPTCSTCKHWKMAEVLSLKGKLKTMTCDWQKHRSKDKDNSIRECKYEPKGGV